MIGSSPKVQSPCFLYLGSIHARQFRVQHYQDLRRRPADKLGVNLITYTHISRLNPSKQGVGTQNLFGVLIFGLRLRVDAMHMRLSRLHGERKKSRQYNFPPLRHFSPCAVEPPGEKKEETGNNVVGRSVCRWRRHPILGVSCRAGSHQFLTAATARYVQDSPSYVSYSS